LKKVEEIRTDGLLSGGGGGVPKITGSLHLNCTYQEKSLFLSLIKPSQTTKALLS